MTDPAHTAAADAAEQIADLVEWHSLQGTIEAIIQRAISSSQRPYAEYLAHKPHCDLYGFRNLEATYCTCGLDELRKQVGGEGK